MNEDLDRNEFISYLNVLKKLKTELPIRELINWFNENDIDYINMTDLDMYIYYIEKNIK